MIKITKEIKWPQDRKGHSLNTFRRHCALFSERILKGKLLAIDPASGSRSSPGYALFEGGELKESGVIEIPAGHVSGRLSDLHSCLTREFKKVDVLAIEKLRGAMVHTTLHWSVGVIVSAIQSDILLEVPIVYWQALAKSMEGYQKSDELDAELIGQVCLMLAGSKY